MQIPHKPKILKSNNTPKNHAYCLCLLKKTL